MAENETILGASPTSPVPPVPIQRFYNIDLYRDGEFIKQYITEVSDQGGPGTPVISITALWYYYKDNILYLLVMSAYGYTPSIEEVIAYGDKYEDISSNYIKDEESGTFITVTDFPWNLYMGGSSSAAYEEKRLDIFSSTPSGYSITYHANGGTPEPENLTEQTNLPNPLPTVSKANFTFDGWYTDSTFTTPAVASAEINADTDLYAKFTRSHITLDLSTIGLPAGTHSIQMRLSDDGVTKRDSALSNAVTYTVSTWEYPVEDGDNLIITQANTITEDGDYLIIE